MWLPVVKYREKAIIKMPRFLDDTIAAVASPAGEGGIGIVRISGPESERILKSVFSRGDKASELRPRELTYGHIVHPNTHEPIDEVLAVYMPAPHTYTREDVVEIDCHGGSVAISAVLNAVISAGARLADPGEFTKKAFLNGRIDLSQAEAVLDVINAKTQQSLDVALSQLRGDFSEEIAEIRKKIIDALVELDVNIDYPDEDIEEITNNKLKETLKEIRERLMALIESAQAGKILRDGLNVVIVGRPNAGKSSLLNALLRESRAIVTDIPGTTRDTIQEFANIRGIPVKLTDTAGIRETEDVLENIGIERTKESLADADICLLVVDVSETPDEETKLLAENINKKKSILIFNKSDKPPALSEEERGALARGFSSVLTLSIKEDEKASVSQVEDAIFAMSGLSETDGAENVPPLDGNIPRHKNTVTNQRHKAMLMAALRSIEDAIAACENNEAFELIEIDVRNAYEEMGFITGDSVQDDIIDEIFNRFCLGK